MPKPWEYDDYGPPDDEYDASWALVTAADCWFEVMCDEDDQGVCVWLQPIGHAWDQEFAPAFCQRCLPPAVQDEVCECTFLVPALPLEGVRQMMLAAGFTESNPQSN